MSSLQGKELKTNSEGRLHIEKTASSIFCCDGYICSHTADLRPGNSAVLTFHFSLQLCSFGIALPVVDT